MCVRLHFGGEAACRYGLAAYIESLPLSLIKLHDFGLSKSKVIDLEQKVCMEQR